MELRGKNVGNPFTATRRLAGSGKREPRGTPWGTSALGQNVCAADSAAMRTVWLVKRE